MLSRRLFAASAAGAAAAAGASAVLAAEAKAQTAPTDSTMDRVKSSKVLRIAALPGEAPYFNKDLATGQWSGMCIDMAKDIASQFDGTVEYVESTYGNSVLDLQANKIDLAFALNPTPKRALVIDFTHPFICTALAWSAPRGSRRRTGPTSTSRRSRSPSTSARCTRSRRAALPRTARTSR